MSTITEQRKAVSDEHAAAKLRFLEVDSAIAEATRSYLVDGIPMPRAELATLWAESKRLQLELHKFNEATRLEKVKAIRLKELHFMRHLRESLVAMKLEHLIDEAHDLSLTNIKDAGLFEFYKSKS